MHHTDAQYIVFRDRIIFIQSNGIRSGDELRVRTAKLAVGTGIVEIPGKLFAGNLDDGRILRSIREVDRSPDSLPHKYKDRENHGGSDQQESFSFGIVVPV